MTEQQINIIKRLDAYAIANYDNGGWDYWVETYDPSDKLEAIEEFDNYEDALADLKSLFLLLDNHRREIQSTAF